jgi:acetyl-CoA synthetase
MRRLLRDVVEGRQLGDVSTLRDPAVMAALQQQVTARRPRPEVTT